MIRTLVILIEAQQGKALNIGCKFPMLQLADSHFLIMYSSANVSRVSSTVLSLTLSWVSTIVGFSIGGGGLFSFPRVFNFFSL